MRQHSLHVCVVQLLQRFCEHQCFSCLQSSLPSLLHGSLIQLVLPRNSSTLFFQFDMPSRHFQCTCKTSSIFSISSSFFASFSRFLSSHACCALCNLLLHYAITFSAYVILILSGLLSLVFSHTPSDNRFFAALASPPILREMTDI